DAAKITREIVAADNGLRSVVWEQSVDDIPVFEGVLISHTTAKGELASISSHFISDTARAALMAKPNRAPTLTALQAVEIAAHNLDTFVNPGEGITLEPASGPEQKHRFDIRQLVGETRVELTWLPINE